MIYNVKQVSMVHGDILPRTKKKLKWSSDVVGMDHKTFINARFWKHVVSKRSTVGPQNNLRMRCALGFCECE